MFGSLIYHKTHFISLISILEIYNKISVLKKTFHLNLFKFDQFTNTNIIVTLSINDQNVNPYKVFFKE